MVTTRSVVLLANPLEDPEEAVEELQPTRATRMAAVASLAGVERPGRDGAARRLTLD